MRKKKRGLGEVNQPSPQRLTGKIKRQFNSKLREIKSQESLLLFLFVANYSKILTEPMIELIWNFMEFLKSEGYQIVNNKEVFCVPASKLARLEDLK